MKLTIEAYERQSPKYKLKVYKNVTCIPHVGDFITIDGPTYEVKTVFFDFDTNEVLIRCV